MSQGFKARQRLSGFQALVKLYVWLPSASLEGPCVLKQTDLRIVSKHWQERMVETEGPHMVEYLYKSLWIFLLHEASDFGAAIFHLSINPHEWVLLQIGL